ncbi:hypothetical protein [Arthrobacter sp. B3I4]|uniref:hypothetical protein n=1 Tax=Arthrobacter sp. B3I4 TaxID=3042267 RepID=UPI00277D7106|nr:hypothetical protein [Arthrobacter sp. B3I4]MDQ0756630.1 hypothetical protein [Arthrobacter sp. B3I4]
MASNRLIRCVRTILLALVTVLALSGCYNSGSENYKSVAVGSNLNLAGLELRSISIASRAENQPGRLLGAVFNPTGEDIKLTIGDRDNSLDLTVPAKGQLPFDTAVHILQTTDEPPGARTDLTVGAKGEKSVLNVPVLDGTLEQYAPYVPK